MELRICEALEAAYTISWSAVICVELTVKQIRPVWRSRAIKIVFSIIIIFLLYLLSIHVVILIAIVPGFGLAALIWLLSVMKSFSCKAFDFILDALEVQSFTARASRSLSLLTFLSARTTSLALESEELIKELLLVTDVLRLTATLALPRDDSVIVLGVSTTCESICLRRES